MSAALAPAPRLDWRPHDDPDENTFVARSGEIVVAEVWQICDRWQFRIDAAADRDALGWGDRPTGLEAVLEVEARFAAFLGQARLAPAGEPARP